MLMAKISLNLVFALVVSVALHSVLCEDNPWASVIEQAKHEANKAGFSDETIFGAEKAVADGTAQKAAQEAFGGGNLNDWVEQASDVAKEEGLSSETELVLPDDEEEDNFVEELVFAPRRSPSEAPTEAPSEAPEAQTPSAESNVLTPNTNLFKPF